MTQIEIISPKRDASASTKWDEFFPYYAGYPERFATTILRSMELEESSVVFDPWSGSGTTPYAATRLGLNAIGLDINPAMVIVSKARLFSPSEASVLVPLGAQIANACKNPKCAHESDPLNDWFDAKTAGCIRSIESEIRKLLVGTASLSASEVNSVSCTASVLYVALFSVARSLVAPFQSSNPTWTKAPKNNELRVSARPDVVKASFQRQLSQMADALSHAGKDRWDARAELVVGDSTALHLPNDSVDAIVTSPPYCTRIDYATNTRTELAVLHGLFPLSHVELGREMLGSVRVPRHDIQVRDSWGKSCADFLCDVSNHASKASGGYYLKTHLDYYDKLDKSVSEISRVLKRNASAVMVVQDSFYKDVHNDLPKIISEIAGSHGMAIRQRSDFPLRRSMGSINRKSRVYRSRSDAVEAVLCFSKE